MPRDYRNIRVFLAEDEFLIGSDLQANLEARGFHVFGPYPTMALARAAVGADHYDLAIVDMNLHGMLAYPVVDELMRRKVPLVILSGYSTAEMPSSYRGLVKLTKPCTVDALLGAIDRVLAKGATAP